MARGRLFAGTSGFSYAEWKPGFYPAGLKPKDMLRHYSERLPSVEINNTFYRAPTERAIQGWSDQTPHGFAFALKAPQRITHVARLRDVDEPLEQFLRTARALGPRLGPILFQCPPSLRYDPGVLDAFLARLPALDRFRFSMEFRHASFESDEVRAKLARTGIAWCVADTDVRDAPPVRTAPGFAYLRLRKAAYGDDAVRSWAKTVDGMLDEGTDVYCYFKHEDSPTAPAYALRLRDLAG